MLLKMFPELSRMVHDYARPKTRPDWRHLHKYTMDQYKYDIQVLNSRLFNIIYYNSIDGGFLPDHNIKSCKGLIYFNDTEFIIYRFGTYSRYSYTIEDIFIDDKYYRNTHQLTKELYFRIDYKAALFYCGVCFVMNKIEPIIIIREMLKECFQKCFQNFLS